MFILTLLNSTLLTDTWTVQAGVSAAEGWFGIGAGGFHELGPNKCSSGYRRSAVDDRNTVNITALRGRFTPRDIDEVSPSAPQIK